MEASRIDIGRRIARRFKRNPDKGPRIVFLTGGSGSKSLAAELLKFTWHSSHLEGFWDSGGSSREIRRLFGLGAPGDIRNRLMACADRTSPGQKEIAALLDYRLPTDAEPENLEQEFHGLLTGSHHLLRAVIDIRAQKARPLADTIRRALKSFNEKRLVREAQSGARPFDLSNASIGNLVLTGMYFLFDESWPAAIHHFAQLINVRANVIPTTLMATHLSAELNDGSFITGQHLITKTEKGPIKRVWATPICPPAYDQAIMAIQNAELIAMPQGSFFTSELPHLLVGGIAQAIRQSPAPKVFVPNGWEDKETRGMSVGDMVDEILRVMRENDHGASGCPDTAYLSAVIANITQPADNTVSLLRFDPDRIATDHPGIKVYGEELLDKDGRSHHPANLAYAILSFC